MVKFLRHPPSDLGYQGLFLFLLFLFPFYSSLSIFYFIFLFIFFHRARSWNPTQASTWKRANRDNPRESDGSDMTPCSRQAASAIWKQNFRAGSLFVPETLGYNLVNFYNSLSVQDLSRTLRKPSGRHAIYNSTKFVMHPRPLQQNFDNNFDKNRRNSWWLK